MKKLITAFVPMIALSLTLPATTAVAAKTEKAAKKGAVIVPPPAGKGQVVFWRPGTIVGAAIRCTVREEGAMVGRLGPGKYFVLVREPGLHKFTTKTEATDDLSLEVEADETTYVKCKIGAGIAAGRPNLSPSTKEDFGKKAAKMKLQDQTDMASDIAEDEAKKAKSR
jgi:Protein of unknown function (DUF2846)